MKLNFQSGLSQKDQPTGASRGREAKTCCGKRQTSRGNAGQVSAE